MRLAAPDVILFTVGLLLFSGATYAIWLEGGADVFGETGSASGVYDVTFATEAHEHEAIAVESPRSGEVAFTVNETNVAKMTIRVECSDSQAGAAAAWRLSVTVTGPNNLTSDPLAGTCGQDLEIPIEVAPVPGATSVAGSTEDEARANLPVSSNATRAQGEWTVTISGGRQGGGAVPIPGQVPIPDPTVGVAYVVEQWEPRFAAVQR